MKGQNHGNVSMDKLMYNLDSLMAKTPITCNWFINDICNNNCSYCSYSSKMKRFGNNITYEMFVKCANRLKELGVKGIVVEGGGEPTICPGFKDMMDYLDEIQMPYILLTNWNVYHEIKPRTLRISLDAWDENSYQEKRGVRRYKIVRENIERYIQWKQAHSPDTEVGIQLVATNPSELIPFYEGNKDLDVDYIQIKAIETVGGEFFKDNDDSEYRTILNRLHKGDKRVTLNYKWDNLNVKFKNCIAHPYQIALKWDGNVMVCCHRPADIIGNIFDEDILDKNRNTEYDMSKCAIPCRLTGPNMFMEKINNGSLNSEFI